RLPAARCRMPTRLYASLTASTLPSARCASTYKGSCCSENPENNKARCANTAALCGCPACVYASASALFTLQRSRRRSAQRLGSRSRVSTSSPRAMRSRMLAGSVIERGERPICKHGSDRLRMRELALVRTREDLKMLGRLRIHLHVERGGVGNDVDVLDRPATDPQADPISVGTQQQIAQAEAHRCFLSRRQAQVIVFQGEVGVDQTMTVELEDDHRHVGVD